MAAFTIVIPSHNRPDLLRQCLASVVRYSPPHTEVIVVDDASVDGSVSTAASEFPSIRIVRLNEHAGFCTAANTGVRLAGSPLVELLNDDTEVTAGWAEAALAAFARADVGAVAPLVLRAPPAASGHVVDSAGDRYFIGGIAGKRGHNEILSPAHLRPSFVFGASGSSAFYRRDLYLRVGGLPEEFGAYFDDVDLSFRLHRAGFRVWYEPSSQVWHRVSASHGVSCPRLLQQQSRNEESVFWRNLPGAVLLRALPWHVAVVVAKAWRRCREGTLRPFLRGRLEALANLPEALRHNRRLRAIGPPRVGASWELSTSL